jgi:hypothetical protein
MPRLSNNSVSVRGRPLSYQRDQVDNEAAPASSGMRMRQRGRQSETRGLTLGSVLSADQTRPQSRSAANSRTRLRSVSSVQRNKGDFRFSMAPSVHFGTSRSKNRHGSSARAVIRITGPQKFFHALGDGELCAPVRVGPMATWPTSAPRRTAALSWAPHHFTAKNRESAPLQRRVKQTIGSSATQYASR